MSYIIEPVQLASKRPFSNSDLSSIVIIGVPASVRSNRWATTLKGLGAPYLGKGSAFPSLLAGGLSCCPPRGSGRCLLLVLINYGQAEPLLIECLSGPVYGDRRGFEAG
jgi:hypothetical protein